MKKKKDELSKEQVMEVMDFVSTLDNSYIQGLSKRANKNKRQGFYSPQIQNDEEKRKGRDKISKMPTEENLSNAIYGNDGNFGLLQAYSEFFDTIDSIYSSIIKYISGLLSFDLSISCKNIKDVSEYKSQEYKEDLQRVYRFFDFFDYKHEFSKVYKNLILDGVNFVWFRDSKTSYSKDKDALEENEVRSFTLQQLPQDRCLITNIYNKGDIGFDFDINYFNSGTIDVGLYDDLLIKKYDNVSEQFEYIPSNKITNRNGMYGEYVQTSTLDGAYCFKVDDETLFIKPPLVSMFKTLLTNEEIKDLQKDKDILSAYYLLAGEIGTMTTKSGDRANQTKFTPEVLGDLLSYVTSGLKRNVKPVAMPVENIRGWQYNDQNPNMYNNKLKESSAQGISASKLIYNTDTSSQSVIQNAILSDYNYWKKLYFQFERFLEFYVNMKTKKYKFSFRLDGSNYLFERESRRKSINELANLGLTLNLSAWASAYGYEPHIFERMLQEAHNSNFTDNLTLLMNKNIDTNSVANNDINNVGGRPKKEDIEISDSRETSLNNDL